MMTLTPKPEMAEVKTQEMWLTIVFLGVEPFGVPLC